MLTKFHRIRNILIHLYLSLCHGIRDLLSTFSVAAGDPWIGLDSGEYSFRKDLPIFYGGYSEEDSLRYIVIEMSIGALFGSIHCAAWAFNFPSTVEQQLWQITSLIITASPLVMLIMAVILDKYDVGQWAKRPFDISRIILVYIYLLARLSIFVLSFLLLRGLPADVLEEVQWSKFVPHV